MARGADVPAQTVIESSSTARGPLWFVGLLSLACASLVVATAWVDPAKAWPSSQGVERTLARRMADGDATGVAFPNALDMRIVQHAYASAATQSPEVLVVGPSSMRAINAELFDNRKVYNAHAPGMQLEDLLWLTELYHANGHIPDTMVIGLSPWALLGDEDMSWRLASWRRYADGVAAMKQRLGALDANDQRMLSWSSFAARWGTWFEPTRIREAMVSPLAHEAVLIEPAYPQLDRLVRPDGSHWVEAQLRHRPQGEVESEALSPAMLGGITTLLNGLPARVEDLEPSRLRLFETYLTWLADNGVEVEFALPPMHPLVYDHIHERFPIIDSMEAYLRRTAEERALSISGSYNPGVAGCTAPMFIDAFHFDRPCAYAVFSAW